MRVVLKGIASATKRLSGGSKRTYWYAWRGGPRLDGQPGSPEFIASYNEAIASLTRKPEGTLAALLSEFKGSAEYRKLSAPSKRSYDRYLHAIEAEFGDMPLKVLEDPRCRGDFKAWRDSMAATPRKADYAWTTLARVLSFAKDRGRLAYNACERGGRIYDSARADRIWTPEHLTQLQAVASAEIWAVVFTALWTGQRQGDLLALPWSSYDTATISLRQGKTGAKVNVPVGEPLRALLAALPRRSPVMFLNTFGQPWTSDGFRTSFGKAVAAAGLADADLHFNDLRGTAVTRLAVAGATDAEIAIFTGHSLVTVRAILDKHYLKRDEAMGINAIRKLERYEKKKR